MRKPVEFAGLLKPEYIASSCGSSLDELQNAAKEHGLYAKAVKGFTVRELAMIRRPVILHVRKQANTPEFTHYYLLVECEEDHALILDPPNGLQQVPLHKLALLWDGTGLIVSKTAIKLENHIVGELARSGGFILFILAVLALLHRVSATQRDSDGGLTKHAWFRRCLCQGSVLIGVSVLFSIGYHSLNRNGFLANGEAVAAIIELKKNRFIPRISTARAKKLLATETVFIDARNPTDFRAGHVAGAVNLPTTSGSAKFDEALKNVSADVPIVVYCQSDKCPYADVVAPRILSQGFSDVRIYQGGWENWAESEKP